MLGQSANTTVTSLSWGSSPRGGAHLNPCVIVLLGRWIVQRALIQTLCVCVSRTIVSRLDINTVHSVWATADCWRTLPQLPVLGQSNGLFLGWGQ